MLEILAALNMLAIVALCVIVGTKVRKPAPPPVVTATPVKSIDIDGILRELHEMSRNTGARVHIHDIEQKLKDASR